MNNAQAAGQPHPAKPSLLMACFVSRWILIVLASRKTGRMLRERLIFVTAVPASFNDFFADEEDPQSRSATSGISAMCRFPGGGQTTASAFA